MSRYTETVNIFCRKLDTPRFVLEMFRTHDDLAGYTVESSSLSGGHSMENSPKSQQETIYTLTLEISTLANIRGIATDVKRTVQPRVNAFEGV